METIDIVQHNILLSYTSKQQFSQEQFWSEHTLSMLLSGEGRVYNNEETQRYTPGTIGLLKRNQLAKTVKIPSADGKPFKSVGIILDQETLRRYSAANGLTATSPYTGKTMLKLNQNHFISGFFDSLLPYFEQPGQLTKRLSELKTKEAIELLLSHDPGLKELLFDFSEPFKIDLETFMNSHFTYNVPIKQFAKLTGRSMSTFKRDFKKAFHQTPERWLKDRRLDKAHFLISELRQRPSEVYLQVGFENFSHFSASFKQRFGYNASTVGQ
ncbi:helix-turn-helix transcriptional regulator [Parapedobacter sp. ISTM3]|uniref:helix-turn-helix domain-containing protein n=1 Tax=Parapedobacter sp. ISTM3 TaxID=2800130 RepID=UPI0019061455|nr:AraC family transcriptional regulator [Parapedobacter sp. ISTM3]MBK1439253.1 helix-turn-helix transcriptional regulator [Parapedobacter sp. ISTM3]